MDQPQLISAADVDGNPHESFLGELDITSDRISLTGLDREIETFADGALLRAILDGGKHPGPFCPCLAPSLIF